MLELIRYVDKVIPKINWNQKLEDIKKYKVDVIVMGDGWKGYPRFECLKDYCEVVYLERTKGISTTKIKKKLNEEG